MRVKIYRVMRPREGRTYGVGPYHDLGYEHWHRPGAMARRHPSPADDFTVPHPGWEDYRYGFRSRAQLGRWFTAAELRRLARFGFGIYTFLISASDIIFGQSQVCFRVRDPRKLLSPDDTAADARIAALSREEIDARVGST